MNKMINSYKCDLWLGNPCLYKDIEYEANKTYHFITKVIVVALKINGGASYAVCHYNGNLPTHKGMGFSELETRSLYHFVYKLNLLIP